MSPFGSHPHKMQFSLWTTMAPYKPAATSSSRTRSIHTNHGEWGILFSMTCLHSTTKLPTQPPPPRPSSIRTESPHKRERFSFRRMIQSTSDFPAPPTTHRTRVACWPISTVPSSVSWSVSVSHQNNHFLVCRLEGRTVTKSPKGTWLSHIHPVRTWTRVWLSRLLTSVSEKRNGADERKWANLVLRSEP